MDPKTLDDAIATIVREQVALLVSKQRDYGKGNIAVFGEKGVLVRTSDKLERLKNLVWTDKAPLHESVDDTWRDIVNYGIIAQLVRRGQWDLPLKEADASL